MDTTTQTTSSSSNTDGSVIRQEQVGSHHNGMDIDQILDIISNDIRISDLHISAGDYVSYRMNGDIIKKTERGIVSAEFMELFLKYLLQSNGDKIAKFRADKDMDFAYISKHNTPYRVNAFVKLGKVAAVMRKINAQAKKLEDLMYEDIATTIKSKILNRKTGLFLVTGPTGSGKSTSLVAMLEYLNNLVSSHMITIEDPIEFIFKAQKCLISQRELGGDTRSFTNALRSAMREDPDIVFVGEIRDPATAEAALNLAETGHLVFSTLHTSSASSTINRYISLFPAEIQANISDRLADSLSGVLSQYLVKAKDGQSRMGLYELMINNMAVRNNIRKGDIRGIDNIIETSSNIGMISMKSYAERLLTQDIIDPNSVGWLNIDNNNK